MNLGTVLYLPPHGRLNSDAFAANLWKFKTRYPVLVLTDDSAWLHSRVIDNPEKIGRRPAHAINNFLWLKCLQLAGDSGLDYFIYLEADSRAGCDHWDARLFDEFFGRYPNGIDCAGSPVAWDLPNGGREFAMRIIEAASAYQKVAGVPMSFHGGKHPHDSSGSCYYPNGSCAIYSVAALLKLFAGFDRDIAGHARLIVPWDMEIGRRIWFNHSTNSDQHVGWLAGAYSGFGDAVVSLNERFDMLKSGRKCLIHQWKGDGPNL